MNTTIRSAKHCFERWKNVWVRISPAVRAAWVALYDTVAAMMKQAASGVRAAST
jgi:hypothetical protein